MGVWTKMYPEESFFLMVEDIHTPLKKEEYMPPIRAFCGKCPEKDLETPTF